MEQVSSINRWSKARKNLKRPKRNTSSTFRNVYKKLSTTDPRELDICIEETSRDRSSPLSEEEEYKLLKTTNVLVIFFTTRSRIWQDQNLSSSKLAQRDFPLKDGENRKQTEINYYDFMIMRIFSHQKKMIVLYALWIGFDFLLLRRLHHISLGAKHRQGNKEYPHHRLMKRWQTRIRGPQGAKTVDIFHYEDFSTSQRSSTSP